MQLIIRDLIYRSPLKWFPKEINKRISEADRIGAIYIKEVGAMRKLNEEKLEKLPTFNQQLNDECGRQGTPARDEFHEEALSWYYGQILRSRRQELRMTQKQLADKLGREQSYIARVERGKVDVQLSSFLRIAAALGIQFVPTVANALR